MSNSGTILHRPGLREVLTEVSVVEHLSENYPEHVTGGLVQVYLFLRENHAPDWRSQHGDDLEVWVHKVFMAEPDAQQGEDVFHAEIHATSIPYPSQQSPTGLSDFFKAGSVEDYSYGYELFDPVYDVRDVKEGWMFVGGYTGASDPLGELVSDWSDGAFEYYVLLCDEMIKTDFLRREEREKLCLFFTRDAGLFERLMDTTDNDDWKTRRRRRLLEKNDSRAGA